LITPTLSKALQIPLYPVFSFQATAGALTNIAALNLDLAGVARKPPPWMQHSAVVLPPGALCRASRLSNEASKPFLLFSIAFCVVLIHAELSQGLLVHHIVTSTIFKPSLL